MTGGQRRQNHIATGDVTGECHGRRCGRLRTGQARRATRLNDYRQALGCQTAHVERQSRLNGSVYSAQGDVCLSILRSGVILASQLLKLVFDIRTRAQCRSHTRTHTRTYTLKHTHISR